MLRFAQILIFISAGLLFFSVAYSGTQTSDPDAMSLQERAFENRVADYSKLLLNGNIGKTFDYMPPRVKDGLVEATGKSPDDLKKEMQERYDGALETVNTYGTTLKLDGLVINSVDSGLDYILIPTVMGGQQKAEPYSVVETQSDTIALHESGEWYFLALYDPTMINLLKYKYPELESISVKETDIKVTEKDAN
jgi:hypothetical protein